MQEHTLTRITTGTTMAKTIGSVMFRAELWYRGQGRCGICGEPLDPNEMHVDHALPQREAGDDALENLRAVHPRCNLRRRDSHPRSRRDTSVPLVSLHVRVPAELVERLNAMVGTTRRRPTLFKVIEEGLRQHAETADERRERRMREAAALMPRYAMDWPVQGSR